MNYLRFLAFLITIFNFAAPEIRGQLPGDKTEGILSESFNTESHVDRLNEAIFNKWVYRQHDDNVIYEARQVLDIARDIGYKKGEADALTNLVRLFLLQYESSISLAYALDAIKLYEEIGDMDRVAYNLMQIGVIYYTSQNFEKSQEYYDRAIKVATELDNEERVATLNYLSGLNNTRLKNYGEALTQLRYTYEYRSKGDNLQGMAECLTGIAEIFLSRHQPDSALFYIRQVRDLMNTTESEYGLSKVNTMESRAYLQKDMVDKASFHAVAALELAEQIDARELRLDAYENLSKTMQLSDDYKRAYSWHLKYMALRDSIFNEKNSMRINQLESAYRIEQTENQVAILEKEKRINQILLRGGAGFTIVVLIFSIVIFRQFRDKQKSNKKLTAAYEKLQSTQEQLIHHKKMASLGHLASGIAHEIQNPLNFVNNFSELSIELLEELKGADLTTEQAEALDEVIANNMKIAEHGSRAQAIVRNMQDHSNMSSGILEETDINQLISSCIERLFDEIRESYPDFTCTVRRELDPSVPKIKVQSSQMTRVIQNIMNNAFQAVQIKKALSADSYIPEVLVETGENNEQLQILIRDNGVGLSEQSKERAFEPFFTTKSTSTGLGLSLSYDIIVAHHGEIELNSQQGEYTEVIIRLPVS